MGSGVQCEATDLLFIHMDLSASGVAQQHLLQDGLEDQLKSKAGKSFKANYLEFWDKIMRECQSADILFDNYLLEKVSFLVIALSWWELLPSLLYRTQYMHLLGCLHISSVCF